MKHYTRSSTWIGLITTAGNGESGSERGAGSGSIDVEDTLCDELKPARQHSDGAHGKRLRLTCNRTVAHGVRSREGLQGIVESLALSRGPGES